MPTIGFTGKSVVQTHHMSVPFRTLDVCADQSLSADINPTLDTDLLIEGDNLEALKALLPRYAGKVDVVCIDPPYNTGNEQWFYNDKVNSPLLQEWFETEVTSEDLERHDKWLCMMLPRLKLTYELMAETGVIFICIDDDEQHTLRMLCDEIFGRENFINNVVWQKKYAPANDAKYFSDDHDFVLVYAKNKEVWRPRKLERTQAQDAPYKYVDAERGRWRSDNYTSNKSAEERPNLYYPITNPKTGEEIWPSKTQVWRYSKETHERHVKEDLIWWGKDGTSSVPAFKRFLDNVGGRVPQTIWPYEDVGHTQRAKRELKAIFHDRDRLFDTPKPVELIKRMIKIGGGIDSLVLDAFAGSGTTGHAVWDLNREDGGNRRFVLVECEQSVADEITAERLRRVSNGLPDTTDEAFSGYGNPFTYAKLGEALALDSFFEGEMPAYSAVASYIAYTATGGTIASPPEQMAKDGYIGTVEGRRLHLLYKPDPEFMRGQGGVLTPAMAEAISKANAASKLPAVVFGAVKWMSQSELSRRYNIQFCQLPYTVYRIFGDSVST